MVSKTALSCHIKYVHQGVIEVLKSDSWEFDRFRLTRLVKDIFRQKWMLRPVFPLYILVVEPRILLLSRIFQKNMSVAVVYIRGLQQWYISEVCSSGIY